MELPGITLVRLIVPGGVLWKPWVAAHWERRLKREDHQTADVRSMVGHVLEHLRGASLHSIGHLLLGMCRILLRQAVQLQDDAEELRLALLTSSRGGSGGGPRTAETLAEAAVTLRRGAALDAPWWDPQGLLDLAGDLEQFDLLEEPLQAPEADLKASIAEGRRFVAPLDTITLAPAPPHQPALLDLEAPRDAFGAPSQEEHAAMERLSQAASSPSQDRDASALPVEFLLGTGSEGEERLRSGDLFAMSGSGRRSGMLDVPGLDGFLGPEGGPFGLGDGLGEGGTGLSPSPVRPPLARALAFDSPDLGSDDGLESARRDEGVEAGTAAAAAAAESGAQPSLTSQLFDTPTGPHAPGTEVSPPSAGAAVGAPMLPGGLPGAPSRASPLGAHDPRSVVAAPQSAQERPPPPKRARKPKPWLDEKIEIPREVYHNRAVITRKVVNDYSLRLAHRSTQVGLTTVFSNLCPVLAEAFLNAPRAGEKRRRAQLEAAAVAAAAEQQAAAERAQAAAAADAATRAAAAPPPPSPPGPPAGPSLGSASPLRPGAAPLSAVAAGMPVGERDADMGLSSPHLRPPQSPAPFAHPVVSPGQPLTRSPPPPSPAVARPGAPSPASAPGRGATEVVGAGLEATGSEAPWAAGEGLAEPAVDPGAALAAPSPGQLPTPSLLTQAQPSPPRPAPPSIGAPTPKRVKVEGETFAEASPDIRYVAAMQGGELRDALGTPRRATVDTAAEDLSFFELCSGPPGGANTAAKRFFNLLELHMEGTVTLSQDEPYGDIAIGRGRGWPANWGIAA